MSEYIMNHTGDQLDQAIDNVLNGYIKPEGTLNITQNIDESDPLDISIYKWLTANIEIPEGYIKPIGNLTDSLINRKTSGAYHEATIPAGYYVNEDIVIHEWNSGQLTGNNTAGGAYVVPYSTIGFTPKYCALIANSDKAKNANMVLAVFGNSSAGRSIYTGSKASLSTTYAINTGGHTPVCDSNGITFPSISSTKYGNFNYRWFALR